MDLESKNFGKGPRELTGAVDLISHYKLLPHHEYFCRRSLPSSLSDTHYLYNVVGDTEVRKGEGMQLDQLIQSTTYSRAGSTSIQPFDLEVLREAFQLKETGPVDLPPEERGIPTVSGKSKSERRHKKHKDRDKKDKEHKKHKHRHKDKDRSREGREKRDKGGHHEAGADHSKKHHEKKRKHSGDEDITDFNNHRHKKSRHKSSKIEEVGAIKVAG